MDSHYLLWDGRWWSGYKTKNETREGRYIRRGEREESRLLRSSFKGGRFFG